MAENVTIARPYAEAIYRLAKQNNSFGKWSEMLQFLSAITTDSQMLGLIGNPKVTAQQLEALFLSLCEKQLDEQGINFVKLLIDNGRLQIVQEIAAAYESLKAEQEGKVEATVTSAFAMTGTQLDDLVNILQSRFGRKIEASVIVNPELIGGVKVEIGDQVFDTSVRGKLQTMAYTLKR